MIEILNPKLTLNKYPHYLYLIEILLELSGLVHRLVNRTPCDLAFQYKSANIPGVKYVQGVKCYHKILPFLIGEKNTHSPVVETEAEKFLNKCIKTFPDKWIYFSKWPKGSPFAVALSHDVDRIRLYSWSNLIRLWTHRNLNLGFTQAVHNLTHPYQDPYFQINNLALQELEKDLSSTFFFLTVPRDKFGRRYKIKSLSGSLRELLSGKFEIGLHASIKSGKSVEKLNQEREILQRIVQNRITGVRYHYLMKQDKFLVIPDLAGFQYDSSLSSTRFWSIPRGITYPHQPWHRLLNRKMQITEVVLSVHDTALINGYSFNEQFISRIVKTGGLLTVLWHQRFFADQFKDFTQQFWHIVELAQKGNGWFANLSEIVNFCRARKSIKSIPAENKLRNYFLINDLELNQSPSIPPLKVWGKGNMKKIKPGKFSLNLYPGDVLKW